MNILCFFTLFLQDLHLFLQIGPDEGDRLIREKYYHRYSISSNKDDRDAAAKSDRNGPRHGGTPH